MTKEEVIEDIKKECPNAKYIPIHILQKWAQLIIDGKYDSKTLVPPEIDAADIEYTSDSGDIDIDVDGDDNNDNDNEYGDVVSVKGIQFVICSGLVVPQQLLKDKIIPLINEEMKKLEVDVDDVYNTLMEDE